MNVFIVYAHPSEKSFTYQIKNAFITGLEKAGHSYAVSDLYKMRFATDMTEAEYLRESSYNEDLPVPEDVLAEQEQINKCDGICFIYPVFWTEAPAKLVGWFDRVWTYGFAYGKNKKTMKMLEKALIICVAGHSQETLEDYGHLEAMRTVMLKDRLFDRAKHKEFIVFDSMTNFDEEVRKNYWNKHIAKAFEVGFKFGRL